MRIKKQYLFVLPFVATLSLHGNDPFGDNIFKEMMQMQQDMDKMFNRMHQRIEHRSSRQIAPLGTYKIQDKSTFIDKGQQYEFITNIPQSKENKIDIKSENGIVSITAKIIEKKEVKTSHGYSSSSSMHMFQQKVALPINADENTLNMGYKEGYLVLTLDKKKEKNEEANKTEVIKENNMSKRDIEQGDIKKERIKLSDDASMSSIILFT